MPDRYDTLHTLKAQFQLGSDGKVLANKLGIIDPNEMDEIELGLLDDIKLMEMVFRRVLQQSVSTDDAG